MSNVEFIQKLEILSARLNRITPNINSGGCCVIAGLVAPHISCYYPTRIRVLDSKRNVEQADITKVKPSIAKNTLDCWNSNGVYFGHVVTEIRIGDNLYYYDTNEVKKDRPNKRLGNRNLEMYEGFLTSEDARALGSISTGWNEEFDRSQIKNLKDCVDYFFTKTIHKSLKDLQREERTLSNC